MEIFSGMSCFSRSPSTSWIENSVVHGCQAGQKMCERAEYQTRGCGSGNGMYMFYLKDFKSKRK